MTKDLPLYCVLISGTDARIEMLSPGQENYAAFCKQVIRRERDAVEIIRASQGNLDSSYSFQSLDIARSFALLYLKELEQAVENSLDRVQSFGVADQ